MREDKQRGHFVDNLLRTELDWSDPDCTEVRPKDLKRYTALPSLSSLSSLSASPPCAPACSHAPMLTCLRAHMLTCLSHGLTPCTLTPSTLYYNLQSTIQGVVELLSTASAVRVTEDNGDNETSSRGHAIFTLELQQQDDANPSPSLPAKHKKGSKRGSKVRPSTPLLALYLMALSNPLLPACCLSACLLAA